MARYNANGIRQGTYGLVTATRTRFGKPTKLIQILDYLRQYGPVSRYELTTKVLGKVGTRKDLRGYYSTNFIVFRESGLIKLDWDSRTYTITEDGLNALDNYPLDLY